VVSYPRRQQYRRTLRAARAGTWSVAALLLALALASANATALAAIFVVVAVRFGWFARHWLSLASRSRIGAHSEEEVRRVLRALEPEGWRVRHALRWQGRGDIDSLAIAPSGVGFVVETKTRRYDEGQLAVVREQAAWLWRRRRRWCSWGVLPVLCVVRERGVHRCEQGVLVVSIDQLLPCLRETAASGGQMV
jgi:hypothetical protein